MKKSCFCSVALSVFLIVSIFSFPMSAPAQHEPVEVTCMSTPFGTPMYNAAAAFEDVFKKEGSWVKWKAQPTPGAMYIVRYFHENGEKMASGQVNHVLCETSTSTLGFMIEGWPPFQKYPVPHMKALFSSPAFVTFFSTFDPEIKTLKDLAGKKVGVAEKSRPFQSSLPNQPYFDKGLGIWDKINLQYLGAINSKDAMLNNKVDAHYSTFKARVDIAPDGTYVCSDMAPDTPTMELLNSGRKLHLIPYDPEIIKRSYDFSKDMALYPVLVKKGACDGIDQDIWGRCSIGVYVGDEYIPDDVLQEIIRVRHKYWNQLSKYHATMKYFAENPYPSGTLKKWIHPGVEKAMKNLGFPLP